MGTLARIVLRLLEDALRWLMLLTRSDESVRAENLVLRRQLAMVIERGIRPKSGPVESMPPPESAWRC